MKYTCLFCQHEVVSSDSDPMIEHLDKEHDIRSGGDEVERYCLVIEFVEPE